MSDESHQNTHVIHASKGGGGMKWLAGAAAAAVLAGGGYYAYKNLAPSQPASEQIAAYDATAPTGDSTRAGPLPSDETTPTDVAPADETPAPAASTDRRTASVTPVRRRTTTRVAAVAPAPTEAVVGITPVSATTEDKDIVVTAARRPVWTRAPSAQRLSMLYPVRALERGREGEASLRCTVLDNGALDCVRVAETNASFGSAAMRVARTFRHASTRADGSAAAGTPVNMRVVFRMEDTRRG